MERDDLSSPTFSRSDTGAMFGVKTYWHRDSLGRSTGAVAVTSNIGVGWISAHRNRAADVLGTRRVQRVETWRGVGLDDVPTVTSVWAVS